MLAQIDGQVQVVQEVGGGLQVFLEQMAAPDVFGRVLLGTFAAAVVVASAAFSSSIAESRLRSRDLHFFLGQIFDQTNDVHVLVTSNKSIGFSPLVTVGESVYNLEPLSFRNTVKLFAFHCPHLHSSRERKDLLEELGGRHKFAEDDEVAQIIKSMLGGGVPAKTFAIAFEMTEEEFQELKGMGDVKERNDNSSEE